MEVFYVEYDFTVMSSVGFFCRRWLRGTREKCCHGSATCSTAASSGYCCCVTSAALASFMTFGSPTALLVLCRRCWGIVAMLCQSLLAIIQSCYLSISWLHTHTRMYGSLVACGYFWGVLCRCTRLGASVARRGCFLLIIALKYVPGTW